MSTGSSPTFPVALLWVCRRDCELLWASGSPLCGRRMPPALFPLILGLLGRPWLSLSSCATLSKLLNIFESQSHLKT